MYGLTVVKQDDSRQTKSSMDIRRNADAFTSVVSKCSLLQRRRYVDTDGIPPQLSAIHGIQSGAVRHHLNIDRVNPDHADSSSFSSAMLSAMRPTCVIFRAPHSSMRLSVLSEACDRVSWVAPARVHCIKHGGQAVHEPQPPLLYFLSSSHFISSSPLVGF